MSTERAGRIAGVQIAARPASRPLPRSFVTGEVAGIDAQLRQALLISGRVTDRATRLPTANVQVSAFDAPTQVQYYAALLTDADGRYVLAVPAGTYKVYFFPNSPRVAEWWNAKSTFETADAVAVRANVTGIDAALVPR